MLSRLFKKIKNQKEKKNLQALDMFKGLMKNYLFLLEGQKQIPETDLRWPSDIDFVKERMAVELAKEGNIQFKLLASIHYTSAAGAQALAVDLQRRNIDFDAQAIDKTVFYEKDFGELTYRKLMPDTRSKLWSIAQLYHQKIFNHK